MLFSLKLVSLMKMKPINLTGYTGIHQVFREFLAYLLDTFQEQNYQYTISNKILPDHLNIVLGAVHYCDYYLKTPMPNDTIIVNLEQLYDGCKWGRPIL